MVKEVPFTQYLLPNGERRPTSIEVVDDVAAMAEEIIARGNRFEAEILTTGHVSFTVFNIADQEDVDIELCPNGPGVRESVEQLIRRVHEAITPESRP